MPIGLCLLRLQINTTLGESVGVKLVVVAQFATLVFLHLFGILILLLLIEMQLHRLRLKDVTHQELFIIFLSVLMFP